MHATDSAARGEREGAGGGGGGVAGEALHYTFTMSQYRLPY